MGFSLGKVVGSLIGNHPNVQLANVYDKSHIFDNVGSILNGVTGQNSAFKASVASQWDFWSANNDYNRWYTDWYYDKYGSPTAQMAAFKAAGLNPNLIYGRADGPSSLSPASGSSSGMSSAGSGALSAALGYMKLDADLRQQDAMTQQIRAQTRLIDAQAGALGMENQENEESGTSRSTSYPVKVFKQSAKAVTDFVNNNEYSKSFFNFVGDKVYDLTKNYGNQRTFTGGDGKIYPNEWNYRFADKFFNFFGG